MHQGAVAVEGEALVWKPASQQSLWDSTRLPDQLDSRRDLDAPFQNTPKPPATPQTPQNPSPASAEPQAQATSTQPISARKAAAGEATGSSDPQPSGPQAGAPAAAAAAAAGERSPDRAHDAAGAVAIPYDWAVSIAPDGEATVDGGPGSIALPSRSEESGLPTKAAPQPVGVSGAGQPAGPAAASKKGSTSSGGPASPWAHSMLMQVEKLAWVH